MNLIQNQVIAGVSVAYATPPQKDGSFTTPFLFVPGMWGTSWVFEPWLQRCADLGIDAYALTLNTGEGVTFEEYRDQTLAVLRILGPVILVGHSLGGLLAQEVAWLNPAEVKGLVLVASAPSRPIWYIAPFWFRFRYLRAICTGSQFCLYEKDARKYILNRVPDPEANLENSRPESGRVLRDVAWGRIVSKIESPVLVVAAMYDRVLPDHIQRKISRRHKATIWLYQMGHMIPREDEGEHVISDIIDWCRHKCL